MVLESWDDIYKCLQIACTKPITTELMDVSDKRKALPPVLHLLNLIKDIEYVWVLGDFDLKRYPTSEN